MYSYLQNLLLLLALLSISSCSKPSQAPETSLALPYSGPALAFQNIVTEYSQKGAAKIILKAPQQYRLQNNDEDFPAGVHLDMYGETGVIKTVLDADSAKYLSEERLYIMMGKVVVNNIIDQQQLETPLLYWDERFKEIYTDTTVKITTPSEILNGVGMRAKHDFSQYKIVKPTGIISVKKAD